MSPNPSTVTLRSLLSPARRVRKDRLVAAAMAAVALCVLGAPSSVPAASGVQSLSFRHDPMWINSGTWKTGTENRLLLVDALNSKIREFEVDDGQLTAKGVVENPAFPRPSLVAAVGKSYLVVTDGEKVVRLNENLEVVSETNLVEKSNGPGGHIGSVYSMAPLGENVLLTFSDVQLRDGTWTSGFLRVPLDDPARFELLYPMAVSSPARTFYLLGYPYVAATSRGSGYFLVMEKTPQLFAVGAKGPLTQITLAGNQQKVADAWSAPTLPEKQGMKSAEALYGALQEARLPAGIYGLGDHLALLQRAPRGDGGTIWTLARFDLAAQRFGAPYRLPTVAAHLTIIPGEVLAVLEKGAVRALGDQPIPSVLLIPKQFIVPTR
jgi:hypothetical protein